MKASCIFIFLAAFPRICARTFELEFNERARGLHINEEGRRVQSGNTVKVFSLWAFASACSFFFSSSSFFIISLRGYAQRGLWVWLPTVTPVCPRPPARQVCLPCKVKRRDARVKATAWPHVGDPLSPAHPPVLGGFPGRCGLREVDYLSILPI